MPKKTFQILIITLLVSGALLGSVLEKSVHPSKSEILTELFSYPDGTACRQPCILGIQSGLTTPDEAKTLIKTHPFTKDNEIRKSQYGDKDYLNVALGKNLLKVRVDYKANQVMEVNLISGSIDGLGSTGIEIDGRLINWSDTLSVLGSPEVVTASAGDGGFIFLAVGLYSDGWCIHAEPENSEDHPPAIPQDSKVIRIGVNCYFLKDLENLK